ncbi:hypothetical protein C2845_PM01G29930 [Panicum miliaceum]|uniref:CRAL-TRIO domain-containing protein n=1 Tax=Panicum miliaceum TaxID=4540 RepID=A0A3L6TS10_PANMI|nr:hypothetical protein C2845_PM01G29930 [Panicum miliaceum]
MNEQINELKAALGPLSARGEKYCSVACLARYLEARNWNVAKARKMLEESLKWRAAYRPEDIRWNTSSHEGQIRFLVYTLENACLNLPEGQEKMVWLIDFTGWTMANAVPIKTARETANILQNHYPERLAVAFLFNPPKVFETFWKVVRYFLDPRSIEKVKFVHLKDEESMKVMHKYIDPKVLPVEFGGMSDVVYNHEQYSELMTKDDIKTANIWGEDAKADHANHVISGPLVPEPRPSCFLIYAKIGLEAEPVNRRHGPQKPRPRYMYTQYTTGLMKSSGPPNDVPFRRFPRARSASVSHERHVPGEVASGDLVRPYRNTTSHDGQIRFLVYVLENAILSLPEGQEKMVWLIDFTGWTMAHATPIKTARESTSILQNYYPERLGTAFLFNPPKVFEAFYKAVKYFLDPRSIEKLNFVYLKDEESMKVLYSFKAFLRENGIEQSLRCRNHASKSSENGLSDARRRQAWQNRTAPGSATEVEHHRARRGLRSAPPATRDGAVSACRPGRGASGTRGDQQEQTPADGPRRVQPSNRFYSREVGAAQDLRRKLSPSPRRRGSGTGADGHPDPR